uniref:Candidate secreted effector n=1 Tax=Meloidogyne incognita TaxID=6306 RepID=A0A914MXH9_MELIC
MLRSRRHIIITFIVMVCLTRSSSATVTFITARVKLRKCYLFNFSSCRQFWNTRSRW